MHIREAIVRGTEILSTSSRSARLDAEIMLGHVLKLQRLQLVALGSDELPADSERQFFRLVECRAAGEPVAYIVGSKEFFGLTFKVTPAVLIPRPETEIIVERALQLAGERSLPVSLLDLGTGSGCIAVSLGHELRERGVSGHISATDASEEALQVACENAKRLGVEVLFLTGDWYGALRPEMKFDFILSNPPYVDPSFAAELERDLSYEPSRALFAEDKGLSALKTIVTGAAMHLNPNGVLICEMGAEQRAALQEFLTGEVPEEQRWYGKIDFLKDLSGRDRALELWVKS